MEGTKMGRSNLFLLAALAALLALGPTARAEMVFAATLASGELGMSGSEETPPNNSPGFGFTTVVLNDAENMITVTGSFFDLVAPATAGHIHLPAPRGEAAPVVFPYTGVPNATSGSIPEQSFAIDPVQLAALKAGLAYSNFHSTTFPGGEVRGQLTPIPEPSTLVLLCIGVAGFGAFRRFKR
jgi:hypothetical protein